MAQEWEKTTVVMEPRLSEIVALYRDLGFEVKVEPVPDSATGSCPAGSEDDAACRTCLEDSEVRARGGIVYTRRRDD